MNKLSIFYFTVLLSACSWGPKRSSYVVNADCIEASHVNRLSPDLPKTRQVGFFDSYRFIWDGTSGLQKDAQAEAFQADLVSIVSGKVMNQEGQALCGAIVRFLGHPEFGISTTRSDGTFDLALNGDIHGIIEVLAKGYLPSQRKFQVDGNDFTNIEDIALLKRSGVASQIALNASAMSVAAGEKVLDKDGERSVKMLFHPQTKAIAVNAKGEEFQLNSATVRATEYTVGANGDAAMPGTLPPASGYTYAVELSIDEADNLDAVSVNFDKPVYTYVENFLNFPIGSQVPSGYYDRQKGAWVPSEDGKVIKILDIVDGLAVVDSDGNDFVDSKETLTKLGFSDEELKTLATQYEKGVSLWRVPVRHFTPWDFNWPYGPPAGALSPQLEDPSQGRDLEPEDPDCKRGSIIECQTQTLGQSIPINGTPYTLNYRSNRMEMSGRTLKIQITGEELPEGLLEAELEISVAGQYHKLIFPAEPTQSYEFIWDGNDRYGRKVVGTRKAKIRLTYVYQGQYYAVQEEFEQSFSRPSPEAQDADSNQVVAGRDGTKVRLTSEWEGNLGSYQALTQGFGGWNLSAHHVYDLQSQTLYAGSGDKFSANRVGYLKEVYAGKGESGFKDKVLRHEASFQSPKGILLGPDGSIYVADTFNHVVRHIDQKGFVTTYAGNGSAGYSGDGEQALDASFYEVEDLAWAPSGGMYVADIGNRRVRYISPDGKVSTYAGSGRGDCDAAGKPALLASFNDIRGIAVSVEGELLIADAYCNTLYKVAASGMVIRLAGGAGAYSTSDGAVAQESKLQSPNGIAVAVDGSIYIAEYQANRIRKIDPQGLTYTVAGTGGAGSKGDDGMATEAQLNGPNSIAVGKDGTIYFTDTDNNVVRGIRRDGSIFLVAGNYKAGSDSKRTLSTMGSLSYPHGLAVNNKGVLFVVEKDNHRISMITGQIPGLTSEHIIVPGSEVREYFVFDNNGQHLETRDLLFSEPVLRFSYNEEGQLVGIEDSHGNTTVIERQADQIEIVAPFGQKTLIHLTDNYLSEIRDPLGRTHHVSYQLNDEGQATGLMASFVKPDGSESSYQFDDSGKLVVAKNEVGGEQRLEKRSLDDGYQVKHISAEGMQTLYHVGRDKEAGYLKNSLPFGGVFSSQSTDSGLTTMNFPSGLEIKSQSMPDSVFGMLAAISGNTILQTPGGLQSELIHNQELSFNGIGSLGDITQIRKSWQLGHESEPYLIETTDFENRSITLEKANGLKSLLIFDKHGKLVESQSTAEHPVRYFYDNRGLLLKRIQGDASCKQSSINCRIETFEYYQVGEPGAGLLKSSFHPDQSRINLVRDNAGQIIEIATQTSTGMISQILIEYSMLGDITQITTPKQTNHTMQYLDGHLLAYQSPSNQSVLSWSYNLDLDPIQKTFSEGGVSSQIKYNYSKQSGLLDIEAFGGQKINYEYYPGTDQVKAINGPENINLYYEFDGPLLVESQLQLTDNSAVSPSIAYTYDKAMRVASMSVGNKNVDFTYFSEDQYATAGEVKYFLDENGRVSQSILEGSKILTSFNRFSEPESLSFLIGSDTLWKVDLQYDEMGRIQRRVETFDGQVTVDEYLYDGLGQLVKFTRNGVSEDYAYDANGNRLNNNASYDGQDRLLKTNQFTYKYQNSSALSSKISTSGEISTYDYDERGSLRSVVLPGGRKISYPIDGLGRRAGRSNLGTAVTYLYNNELNLLAEIQGDGTIASFFVYGNKALTPEYMIRDDKIYRFVSDERESIRLVVEVETGSIMQQIEYDAFGQVLHDSNPGFQPFGFGGGLYDHETGLVRFGARDYDAQIGRWMNRDPILFDGDQFNLYVYVGNDPVNNIDPFGEFGLPGAAIGAGFNIGLQLMTNGGNFSCIDWADVGISALFGAVTPGALGSGKKIWQSRKALTTLSKNLNKARTVNRRTKISSNISKHQMTIKDEILTQGAVKSSKHGLTGKINWRGNCPCP